MSTLISDTLKAKSDFSIIDACDVSYNIDATTISNVEDEIGISSDTNLGRVKVGDNFKLDNGEISLDPFVVVQDEEPTNNSELWIVDKPTPEEIKNASDKLISTDYCPNVNIIEKKDDGLYVKGHKGRIDGVVYLNDIPISATKTISVYINSDTGDDETADGSADKPFKTWECARYYIPHSAWRYTINLYFYGTFTDVETNFESFDCQLNVYMRNTPTFKAVRFLACPKVYLYNSFNINMGTPIGNGRPCLMINSFSWVYYNAEDTSTTWTLKINGGTTDSTKCVIGIGADQGGFFQSINANSVLDINNCYRALQANTGGEMSVRNPKSTVSNNSYGFCTFHGGVIRYYTHGLKYSTQSNTNYGGRVYYGGQVSTGAY